MNQKKFNLTWHTYTDHLREMLHDMMSSNEMTDVTLVSEDKKKFKAHKVVLSASSSVFKSIISDNILSSPIIYLRGIQSLEIESILQFIYLGEAKFDQERMHEFINVARSLEIKEISKDIEIIENEQSENYEQQINNIEIPDNEQHVNNEEQEDELLEIRSESAKMGSNISCQPKQLEKNNGNKYPCDQCNFKAIDQSSLRLHIMSIHDGAKYPCDKCNYKATQKNRLQLHKSIRH